MSKESYIKSVILELGPERDDELNLTGGAPKTIRSTGDRNSLRVSFNIKGTLNGIPNQSIVDLYNINGETARLLRKEGLKVSLKAGWYGSEGQNNEPLELASGGLMRATSERRGTDIVHQIMFFDGFSALTKTNVKLVAEPNASLFSVVKELARNLPVVSVDDSNIIIDRSISIGPKGRVFSGNVADALNALSREKAFSWTVQNGTFQALDEGKSLNRPPVEISPARRNLIKASPNLITISQQRFGVDVTAILDPAVAPGVKIKLTSDVDSQLDGTYVVETVDHSGDSHSDTWEMVIRAYDIRQFGDQ